MECIKNKNNNNENKKKHCIHPVSRFCDIGFYGILHRE